METLLEAIARLRMLGYRLDFAAALTVDETVRFEGASDPDDEAILLALSGPDGYRGLYSAAFGAKTTSDDVDVLHVLMRR